MKNIVVSITLSSLIILSSCTSTLISKTKNRDLDSVIKIGESYTFVNNDGKKQKFIVLKMDENKIEGKNDDQKLFEIEKSQISEVKKGNFIGTALIVVGAIALAVLIPAYASNKPVGR